ncbi:hypothetical protein Gohar_000217 [Gossypium harknessii]|uniref:RNase H type-1 domain-containing protein n=1 Tax=Gossypium harknessii TaxID=34285 RepID=A0A7J9HZZ2_9ROSI|nr:hypothetical protein [Gossypium harknessii]
MASAGEVVRDDKGDWISGFSRSLGVATVLHSELWAILDGLNLAWDRGFRKIILESDSKEAIDIINNGSDFLSSFLFGTGETHNIAIDNRHCQFCQCCQVVGACLPGLTVIS